MKRLRINIMQNPISKLLIIKYTREACLKTYQYSINLEMLKYQKCETDRRHFIYLRSGFKGTYEGRT